MPSVNQVIILGHLGHDPEVKYLPSGDAIANFSVATSERWKNKQTGEYEERTEWHRVAAFGQRAEYAGKYLTKGAVVYVQGRIQTRKWTDKSGSERYTTEIMADVVKGFGGKRGAEAPANPAKHGAEGIDDDIPF